MSRCHVAYVYGNKASDLVGRLQPWRTEMRSGEPGPICGYILQL